MTFKFELCVLGSSSALPTVSRYPSAHVLSVHERIFLIDCGEGTQMQLRRYRYNLLRLNQIFISHIHGDHTFGLIGLLASIGMLGRKNSLQIFGPRKLKQIIEKSLDLFEMELPYEIEFIELNPKEYTKIFEDKTVEVYSFPLKHRVPCWGFKFQEKQKPRNLIKSKVDFYQIPIKQLNDIKNGADFIDDEGKTIENKFLTKPPAKSRSYVYCTDTKARENIVEHIKGVDLLFHEATFAQHHKAWAKSTYHSTAKQAATIAEKAEVGKLIIGHFSTRYKDTKLHVDEARSIFKNTEAVKDGDRFTVEQTIMKD